jgi:cell division protein FtsB
MFNFKKLLKNKWFIIAGSGFILFLLIVEIKQYRNKAAIEREISDLSKQADKLQKNNQDLQNIIAYLKTDSYQEKTAREQLSLRKSGETVYSFSSNSSQSLSPAQIDQAQKALNQSNLSKWWNYFFNN